MPLGEPDTVQPIRFCKFDLGEGFLKGFFLRCAFAIVTFHNQSEMHIPLPLQQCVIANALASGAKLTLSWGQSPPEPLALPP